MKQDLVAGGIGALLLGAIVAFAVVPGGGEVEEQAAEPSAAEVAERRADDLGCRSALLALARQPLDEVLANVAEAAEFERAGGDGGLGFDDWYEPDRVEPALERLAAELSTAGQVPGASQAFFDADLAVVDAASRLLGSVDGTSIINAESIDDARIDLVQAIADLEETCA